MLGWVGLMSEVCIRGRVRERMGDDIRDWVRRMTLVRKPLVKASTLCNGGLLWRTDTWVRTSLASCAQLHQSQLCRRMQPQRRRCGEFT